MPLADDRYEQDFWDVLLVREVWDAVDALAQDERDALLRWLDKWHGKQVPPEHIQHIIAKLRATLGVSSES